MEYENQGVIEEGTPASDNGQPTPAPDGSAPGTPGSSRLDGQTIPYARFKEVNDGYRAAEARAAAAEARAAALEAQAKTQGEGLMQRLQSLESAANRRPLSAEEQAEFDKAIKGLDQIHQQHPTLRHLPQVIETLPKMLERLQALESQSTQFQDQQRQAYAGRHVEKVVELAKAAGFPENQYANVENGIAGLIAHNPQALRMLQSGDTRVIDWAWGELFGHLTRQQNAALLQNKQNMQRLPPAARTGAPGQPAAPVIDPNNPATVQAFKRWQTEQARTIVARG